MKTILRDELVEMKESVIAYLELALKISQESIRALKNNDTRLAIETIEISNGYHNKADKIIDDFMFILTQNPLGKDLRRVVAYNAITKNVESMIHNILTGSKFTIRSEGKLSKTSINRVASIGKIFNDTLKFILDEIKKPSSTQKDLYKVLEYYEDMKNKVEKVRKELYKSLSDKKEEDEIKERLFTFSVCEAIKRNSEKLVKICEHLMFVNNGKNHSLSV